ncbi:MULTISPECIES: hypothetical protein [unclassified Variovorax]|uniref:hypothetical protein n=1 Tax=unclassified Variovorax TaxID=663243 RepID=UPI000837E9B5|nr:MULTISPECIES: hypothetical protein [unclassified Variovorax]PNG49078.1 hypothetical protein CHC06_06315 [Variovorax sp. B2]PNG49463.1 hypothetical protein CHC07_06372 [Variovorax sp. B4]VTV18913.1 hypothetical protein WDL1P2_00525 [Variovorax sp. WDL1]
MHHPIFPSAVTVRNLTLRNSSGAKGDFWTADVQIERKGEPTARFESIVFLEREGMAIIVACHNESMPPGFEEFFQQTAFLDYLCETTARDFLNQDPPTYIAIRAGLDLTEILVAGEYVRQRRVPLGMAVSYKRPGHSFSIKTFDPEQTAHWLMGPPQRRTRAVHRPAKSKVNRTKMRRP